MATISDVVAQLLSQQFPDHNTEQLTMASLPCQILPKRVQSLLESYSRLSILSLTRCDLRNLQNFPKMGSLVHLDLSHNSLQGSLNHLMPCSALTYLDLSFNCVGEVSKLHPLRRLPALHLHLTNNPLCTRDPNWKNRLKTYGIRIAKEPRTLGTAPKVEEKVDTELKVEPSDNPAEDIQRRMSQMRRLFMEGDLGSRRMEGNRYVREPYFPMPQEELVLSESSPSEEANNPHLFEVFHRRSPDSDSSP